MQTIKEYLEKANNDFHRGTDARILYAYEHAENIYLQTTVDKIAKDENITDEALLKQLGHEVYLASNQLRLRRMVEAEAQALAEDFHGIDELFNTLHNGDKVADTDGKEYRVKRNDENLFFMPPRKRNYGFDAKKMLFEHTSYQNAKNNGFLNMAGERVRMFKKVA